ncbi:MAG: EamA/RhaT family transporter, partial [Brachybacterium sp.]|nr:EamA/RhaT family transporter [Brachybacterium sp.]
MVGNALHRAEEAALMRHGVVRGFVYMLLSTFFFAVAGPVAKALYTIGWTPGSVVHIRLTGASLLLLI